jgi:hypothetical protein
MKWPQDLEVCPGGKKIGPDLVDALTSGLIRAKRLSCLVEGVGVESKLTAADSAHVSIL